jgi:Zn-dependent metalloprotease
MTENGLQTFAMHGDDARFRSTVEAMNLDLEAVTSDMQGAGVEEVDPETAARRYLAALLSEPGAPGLLAGAVDFQVLKTETVALTGTKVVKFAQHYRRIPVYGSLVTVELDADNTLLAIHTALGEPADVDPVATISPAQALAVIGDDGATEEPPKLYYYFDNQTTPPRWRLVYIAKDVPNAAGSEVSLHAPDLADYVVDAHTGTLVARLPRTQSMAWSPAKVTATDGLGRARDIAVEYDGAGHHRLFDSARNVRTHDFQYQNVRRHSDLLPGAFVTNPPTPWSDAAVSAHANAVDVANYLLTVLRRDGLDNQGGPLISSINCTYSAFDEPGNHVWRNAAWIGTQMVYGQRLVGDALRSYAIAGDVVAHEITHGLTESTARLEYRAETGALNESYSDIFGILISNYGEASIINWNWEMGEDLDATGIPLRDISDPGRYDQPAHMDDFRALAVHEMPSPDNDNGWVHVNSGIHNKVAHNLLTATGPDGTLVFPAAGVAALFYLALTQYLSRTSLFADSRRGVALAARTLSRNDPPATQAQKLRTVADAFDAVGITA